MPQQIQHGKIEKMAEGGIAIVFPTVFSSVPTVVVSPFWDGAKQAVNSILTVTQVTSEGFNVYSGSHSGARDPFYVAWIAVCDAP